MGITRPLDFEIRQMRAKLGAERRPAGLDTVLFPISQLLCRCCISIFCTPYRPAPGEVIHNDSRFDGHKIYKINQGVTICRCQHPQKSTDRFEAIANPATR
jgi:hypothetical protein